MFILCLYGTKIAQIIANPMDIDCLWLQKIYPERRHARRKKTTSGTLL
jgi:hypothetical protein